MDLKSEVGELRSGMILQFNPCFAVDLTRIGAYRPTAPVDVDRCEVTAVLAELQFTLKSYLEWPKRRDCCFLQCFDTVGLLIWPVKSSPK